MALNGHQQTVGKSCEWITPKWILEPLGEFDLDPSSPVNRPFDTAKNHYTIVENGLKQKWFGRVWLNPPFYRYERDLWMHKMSNHGNGIMLIPASCETRAFANYVWGKCDGLLMLNKRPKFLTVDGRESSMNAGGTIALIAYGEKNLNILKRSGLGYTLVEY